MTTFEDPQAELRKKCKPFYQKVEQTLDEWKKNGFKGPIPQTLDIPPECSDLVYCGAKTRAGTPCRRKDLYANGRCRLHGGLSTGPKTAEGKRRSAANGKTPKKKQTP